MSNKRSRARRAALQAVYQWQVTAQAPHDIRDQFREADRLVRLDEALFERLLRGVHDVCPRLDDHLASALDRPIGALDPVERAILRIAVFELVECPEVPWRVVVNEAVDLAHAFGAENSHRYVNGVLDRVAREVRRAETAPPV